MSDTSQAFTTPLVQSYVDHDHHQQPHVSKRHASAALCCAGECWRELRLPGVTRNASPRWPCR